jgi:hypothetical protein
MTNRSITFLAPALLATALLAGCGGGGGETPASAEPVAVAPGIGDDVTALLAYMTRLLGTTSETGEPVPLGDTALAVDDTAEPAGL